MTEEEYNHIRWLFKGEKKMGRKFGRGETIRKEFFSVNTFPKIHKFEYHRKWNVRGKERTRIDIEFLTSDSKVHFEKKDLANKAIKIITYEGDSNRSRTS